MLEELVLLRHAHALNPEGWQADAQRALSPTGQGEALRAGEWLHGLAAPDAVLCSPATRTRETLGQLAAAGCVLPAPHFEADIYDASLGDLLAVIEARLAAAPDTRRLWLVGHNPGLEQLLFHLDAEARLRAMPTAGIAVLRFDGRLPPTDPGAADVAQTWAP